MTRSKTLVTLATALLAGCVTPVTAPVVGADDGARVYVDGSAVAIGMLAFVNDASTTEHKLDVDVALDSRAAGAIIDYRNGPDAVFGTADDNLFDSIQELDDRYYVGPAALDAIADWATQNGWVASHPDDILGTWDGVTFTLAEAEATLALANTASETYLDDDLALDSRAVDSILAARTIETIQELADLYYVGQSALETLKDAAGTVVVDTCDVPGWTQIYVYADDSDLWRQELPAGLVASIDDMLETTDWCGDAYGDPWFVKVAIDQYDCVDVAYFVELGQLIDAFHGVSWYIEFEVDLAFDYEISACEV